MLSDPLNGLYRAGFAYSFRTQSASNNNIQLSPGSETREVSLTVSQMLAGVQISAQCQYLGATAGSDVLTCALMKNDETLGSWSFKADEVASSTVIADISIPVNYEVYQGDVFKWRISTPLLSPGEIMTFAAAISLSGSPV